MHKRVLVIASLACLIAGPARAQQRVTLVGCVAPVDPAAAEQAPFVLKNAIVRDASRRNGGSNSAKSSTPVGGGAATTRSAASGSNTPKGSTPVRTAVIVDDSRATVSSTTAKASVPIAPQDSSSTYALDAAASELSSLTGRTVEITGAVIGRSGSAAPTLKVDQVSVISSRCEMR